MNFPEPMHGIAELPSYIRLADRLLSAEERQDLIDHVAAYPEAGDIIEGTAACASSTTTTMTSCRFIC